MRLALDCREILNPTAGIVSGIPEYIDGITRAFLQNDTENNWLLFFRADYPQEKVQEFLALNPRAKAICLPFTRGSFWVNHFLSARKIMIERPDILFAPTGQLPFGWFGCAVIVVHDLAIYNHPEWFPGGFSRWFSTKISVPFSFYRAKKIIAISEATKKDLMRLFKIDERKIFVVQPAVLLPENILPINEDLRSKFNLPEKYFLCLGTIEPRKNFSLAIQATKILSDQGANIHLVIAGKRGWKWSATVAEIEKANQNKKIIHELGYVSVEEKYALLAGAQALIFPSLYEGFGLPPLEAMKLGVPVITTASGGLPEACGSAARYVSTNNSDELARAMVEMTDEENRNDYIKKGKNWSEKFTWQKTAEEIIKIFHS